MLQAQQPLKYTNANGAGTTTAKSGMGFLHTITVNTAIQTSLTVYDNTAGSGTKIATFGAAPAGTYTYDIGFTTGLTFVTVGTGDVTVSYI